MNTILLREALRQMDITNHKGKPNLFDVVFITADEGRNTGGERVELKNVCLAKHVKEVPKHKSSEFVAGSKKRPSEYADMTRTFFLENGEIRKCHIRLIIEFNGKEVIY